MAIKRMAEYGPALLEIYEANLRIKKELAEGVDVREVERNGFRYFEAWVDGEAVSERLEIGQMIDWLDGWTAATALHPTGEREDGAK